ncbi:DNA-3-methyladenine glycosylase family protein [Nocardia callitridis]|uniref:DNA-3-methyladenine glycosylase n=1 Tax=Nocardia callitridis TaxID=648753 RepID=A0ABP9KAV0_9NOCA
MSNYETTHRVSGPWSLRTCRRFWEEFAPFTLPSTSDDGLRTTFLSEHDWTPVDAVVTQDTDRARITVTGTGDLHAATDQVTRFLSLDIDATAWPHVGDRDPVIAAAQRALPGFRPCGFHSAYEAAAWAVLSQRTRVPTAAKLRRSLITEHGSNGAFPAPRTIHKAVTTGRLTLPARKPEFLAAVAEAALDGVLDSRSLRELPEDDARNRLRAITGLGPFAADLILVRGTNATDILPRTEPRLLAEIERRYGIERSLDDLATGWRPFRSWAAIHLRALSAA